jgi:anti-sigma-K factor RskA
MSAEHTYTQAELEHYEELCSAYVLGTLNDEEKGFREFEALLEAGDPLIAATLEQMFESSIMLAETAPQLDAPDFARISLLEKVKRLGTRSEKETQYDGVTKPVSSSKKRNRMLIGSGVLVGLLICHLLALDVSKTAKFERSTDLLKSMLRLTDSLKEVSRTYAANDSIMSSVIKILQEENTKRVTMINQRDGTKRLNLFFSPEQKKVALLGDDLKQILSDNTYQLWAIRNKNLPIPVGKLNVNSKKHLLPIYLFPFDFALPDTFAISVETENRRNPYNDEMIYIGHVFK